MRGRPILGAIAGLFFGAFVAIDLQQFAVRPLDNFSVFGIPAIGLILGLALALWAPLGRGVRTKRPSPRPAPASPPPTAGPPSASTPPAAGPPSASTP